MAESKTLGAQDQKLLAILADAQGTLSPTEIGQKWVKMRGDDKGQPQEEKAVVNGYRRLRSLYKSAGPKKDGIVTVPKTENGEPVLKNGKPVTTTVNVGEVFDKRYPTPRDMPNGKRGVRGSSVDAMAFLIG